MNERLQGNPAEPDQPRHSTWKRLGFALAAVPAAFLPLSYVLTVGWVIGEFVFACFRGERPRLEAPEMVFWIGWGAIYATLLQWPFYFFWAAMSRELTWRVRVLWIAHIFLLNMFAMPWFLYCKYRGTTSTALTHGMRHKRIRGWFERAS